MRSSPAPRQRRTAWSPRRSRATSWTPRWPRVCASLATGAPQGLRESKRILNRDLLARIDAHGEEMAALSARLFASDAARDGDDRLPRTAGSSPRGPVAARRSRRESAYRLRGPAAGSGVWPGIRLTTCHERWRVESRPDPGGVGARGARRRGRSRREQAVRGPGLRPAREVGAGRARRWRARGTGAAGWATRAAWSSATRWSSRRPSGSPSSTPPTRGWSSAGSTCDAELDPEPRYIGRIGLRDDDRDSLLIDWRAPAAAVFYQATAAEPQGVVRRRVLRCAGATRRRRRGRAARRRGRDRPADRRRGRADGAAVPGPRPLDALDRRHHPGRAGPGDPRARQGRGRRSPAARAPARPSSRCTARRTCSTPTAAATRAAACWSSARPGSSCATSSGCCPRSARPRSRCGRSARSSTASARPATTSRRSPTSRARRGWPS